MEVLPQDPVVLKYRYSGMAEERGELETLLTRAGVQQLFLAGTQTNICCESTARDAMMRSFDAFLVHDCLAAETPQMHESSVSHFRLPSAGARPRTRCARSSPWGRRTRRRTSRIDVPGHSWDTLENVRGD
jgi:nicotinamidase-related amidase